MTGHAVGVGDYWIRIRAVNFCELPTKIGKSAAPRNTRKARKILRNAILLMAAFKVFDTRTDWRHGIGLVPNGNTLKTPTSKNSDMPAKLASRIGLLADVF